MATLSIDVPKEYPLVLLVSTSYTFLQVWQMRRVGRARRAAGIKYPHLYATPEQTQASSDAQKFNCAQRAHANTLETLPLVLPSLLISGLKYPRFAVGAGLLWLVARIDYTIQYSKGNPEKRNGTAGLLSWPSLFALFVGAVTTGVQFTIKSLQ